MAGRNTRTLTIKIAGQMDKSLTAAVQSANGQVSSLATNLSRVGTAGLAAMTAFATGTVVALTQCEKKAESFESSMANVVKYVSGLADAAGKISDQKWDGNGKTYAENYKEVEKTILDLSTQIPMTAKEIQDLAAAAGQSGKDMNDLFQVAKDGTISGFIKDIAMVGTAMDITAEQAGDWGAKWEKSLNMTHEEIMVLFDQINYLGANSATTAAEIAEVVNGVASLGEVAGMDAASTAALADAMLAMGVDTSTASTSISRMLVNMSKGESATKKQKEAWKELGMTAEGVAASMQMDATGTLLEVLQTINDIDPERQVAILNTLFGQWAVKGAAKLTGNLSTYTDALEMVNDPKLYTGSMEREFNIKAGTTESMSKMLKNTWNALQIEVGANFLPAKKEMAVKLRDTINDLRNMPEVQQLGQKAGELLSTGVAKASDALDKAMPYIQKGLDYLLHNGDKVADKIKKIAEAFLLLKFSPQIEKVLGGIGTVLTGKGGIGSLLPGILPGQEKGRKLGGVLGSMWNGSKSFFQGGEKAFTSTASLVSGVAGSAKKNGLLSTLGAAVSDLISGRGVGGTAQAMATAASQGTLGEQNNIGAAIAQRFSNSKTGGYLTGVGKSFSNFFSTGLGGGVKNIGGKVLGTIGDVGKTAASGFGSWVGKKVGAVAPAVAGSAPVQAVTGFVSNLFQNVKGSKVVGAIGNALPMLGGSAKAVGGGLLSTVKAGAGVLGSIWSPALKGFAGLFSKASPVIGVVSTIIALFSILGDHMKDIEGIVQKVFGDKGLAIFKKFEDVIANIGTFISGLFKKDGIANLLAPLREGFSGLLDKSGFLSTLFGGKETGLAAFDGVVGIIQSIMGAVKQVVDFSKNTVKPLIVEIFNFITQTIVPKATALFAEAAPIISEIITNIGSAVMAGMEFIGHAIETVLPVIESIVSWLWDVAQVVIPGVLAAVNVFYQGVTTLIGNVKRIFDGLVSFITGVFTGNWSKAWDGIKDIFGGVFDALITLCKTPINAVIALINKCIKGINKLGIKIPDWVPLLGGKDFTINIPELTPLARGGMTNGPSLAGEAGREAVISFRPSERARNIALWAQAGKLLGVKQASLKQIPVGGNSNSGRETVTFAPQITIQGNADRDTMEEVMADMYERFVEWYEQMQRRKRRVAY